MASMTKMTAQKHMIHRQIIELSIPEQEYIGNLNNVVDGLNQKTIIPLLDEVFTEVAGPERVLKIDRLEIELGTVSLENFEGEFKANFESELREALSTVLPLLRGDSGSAIDT
jgi:hypothetical protein